MIDNEQKTFLRHAVRRYLAERAPAAFEAASIARMLMTRQYIDFPVGAGDVIAALDLLKGLVPPQVESKHDALGSINYWRITSEGKLAHEREEG